MRVGKIAHFGGEDYQEALPADYEPFVTREQALRALLPAWSAFVLDDPSFTVEDAQNCIDFRAEKTRGQFWPEGMLFKCAEFAIRTVFSMAHLMELPAGMAEANAAGWRMAETRERLASAEWKIVVGDPADGPICTESFQGAILWLATNAVTPAGPSGWASASIVNELVQRIAGDGDDAYVGDCCEDTDVYLYRGQSDFVGAGEVVRGSDPMLFGVLHEMFQEAMNWSELEAQSIAAAFFRDQFLNTKPGAWTPFRSARLCGEFKVLAILADYYFRWAHRLYSRSLQRGQVLEVGVDPVGRGVTAAQRDEEMANVARRRTAEACAKMGLAYVVEFASTLVHEWGHATRNLLSPVKYHCKMGWAAYSATARLLPDLVDPRDQRFAACFQFMFQSTFKQRALAEFGLPQPVETPPVRMRHPFDIADRERWETTSTRDCDIRSTEEVGDGEPGELQLRVEWETCGVWPRRRPLRLTYTTPAACMAEDTAASHDVVSGIWNNGVGACRLGGPGTNLSLDDCEQACHLRAALGGDLEACLAECKPASEPPVLWDDCEWACRLQASMGGNLAECLLNCKPDDAPGDPKDDGDPTEEDP